MAPTVVPDTLPADFAGWDKAPDSLPADFNGWDAQDTPPAPLWGAIGPAPVPPALQGSGTDAWKQGVKQAVLGSNPIGNSITNAGKHLKNDTWGLAKAIVQPPQNFGESVAQAALPGGLQMYRAAIEPSIQPAQQAASEYRSGNPQWQKDALSAVPMVGPAVRQFSDESDQQGVLPALAGAGVDYLTGRAIGAGIGMLGKGGKVVPGQNYTEGQHASMAGVLARGTNSDKGFFPKEVAGDIGSATRQAAADNPAIHDTIMSGTPEQSLAGTQALLQKVREGIDAQHAQALAPVADTPINPKTIQDAVHFPKTLEGFAPEDAAAIDDLKGRLGNIRTIGGLNDLRMYLNKELSNQFKMSKVAAGNSGAVTGAMEDALKATRNMYYNELAKATGQDFQGLKRQEGSVLSAEEALQNAAPRLAAKQAIAEQPMSGKSVLGEAIQGAHTVSGSPIAGVGKLVAQKVFGQMPMTPIQEGIQNFFKGADKLPPSPVRPPAQYVQPIPQPAGPGQPRLNPPAPLELNPPVTPQLNPPTPVAPPYVPRPQLEGQPAPQLSVPQRQPRLGSGEGNPEYVTPPASYPPLNEPTAVTNVNAGRPLVKPIDRPVEESARPINVARSLPLPETHSFSQKAWKASHPNGNLKTALKQAQAKGYRVID